MTTKRDHKATLQGVLQGQGLNVPDSEIYAGPLNTAAGDACIWIVQTGGTAPLDRFGSLEAIQTPRLQINVRNTDVTDGTSDADDVWAIAHDAEPSDYSRTSMLQSAPIYLGQDEDFRHRWSINIEMFISE